MKFNVQSHYLQLWPRPWVCMVELCVLHTLALSWTSKCNETHSWELRRCGAYAQFKAKFYYMELSTWFWVCVNESWVLAHRLTEANIWPKLREWLKGSWDTRAMDKRMYIPIIPSLLQDGGFMNVEFALRAAIWIYMYLTLTFDSSHIGDLKLSL